VDGVSFEVKREEVFCLVGESGCGKTTTARLLLMLEKPTSGRIIFNNRDLVRMGRKDLKKLRKDMQIVFQDPYASLNPRKSVFRMVTEPLEIHRMASTYEEKVRRAVETLEMVGVTPAESFLFKLPHELSGGQRQRVAIARSLVLRPVFLVADEPVSMVDVSIRIGILNLLLEMRSKMGVTLLLITHDLAIARYTSDRIAVMYLGRIVEMASSEELIREPMHPYTVALVSSVPKVNGAQDERVKLKGEVPTPIDVPTGCHFHPRCPYAADICRKQDPRLEEIKPTHYVACHLVKSGTLIGDSLHISRNASR
jgi:oligopeptide/dipeptide ABC transporter ATP-binding protein